jgi:hypothetical protein
VGGAKGTRGALAPPVLQEREFHFRADYLRDRSHEHIVKVETIGAQLELGNREVA